MSTLPSRTAGVKQGVVEPGTISPEACTMALQPEFVNVDVRI